jgi:hypothetical protein
VAIGHVTEVAELYAAISVSIFRTANSETRGRGRDVALPTWKRVSFRKMQFLLKLLLTLCAKKRLRRQVGSNLVKPGLPMRAPEEMRREEHCECE